MSITIKSSPANYSPAHNELWHVVESTNKAGIGFKYIFDIYNGATFLTRVKNSPYGTDKYGVLDVHNIVRSALDTPSIGAFDPEDFSTSFESGADVFFIDYDVRFGEYASGVTTANLASGTYRAYNNYLRQDIEAASTALSSGLYFLSNRPARSNVIEGQPLVMTVKTNSLNVFKRRIVNESNLSVIDEESVPAAIDQISTFGFIPTEGQALQFYNDTTASSLGVRYFNVRCSKYDPYTLVFLNAFGGWDSFSFVHGRISQTAEKKSFERQRWELDGFEMVEKSGLVYNEGNKTYANIIGDTMKLTSDFLNTEEHT